ncbi:MAG: hypothetical protein WDO69_10685 [Pseudomonadota bacterium]
MSGAWIARTFRFVPARLRHAEFWLVAFGFTGLACVYATLMHDVVQNGDAAVYTEQVQQHVFDDRAIHIGYMLLGSVFHALLPLQIDRAMNVMALTFGLAAALALYLTAKHLGSRWAGVASVLLLLCSGSYVKSMVLSEVDILSAALVMISYAFYLHRLNVAAGATFGLAMLTTPVTATFLPLFVLTFAIDEDGAWPTVRVQFMRVLWFGLVALAVYAPFVIWQRQSYFYGGRSVTTSAYFPFDAIAQLERGAHFFMANSWALLALYFAGIVSALTDKSLWRRDQVALGLLLSVLLTALLADRTGDVPVHLPSLAPLALIAVLFLNRLASASKAVWAVPISAFLFMAPSAYLAAQQQVNTQLTLRRRYKAMRAQSEPLRAMLAGFPEGFTRQRFFEHYAYGTSYIGLVPTIAELRARLPQLRSGPEEFVIFFVRRVPRDVERALKDRYELADREVQGAHFKALVPRPH